jgi:uncharacterized protein (TIGR02594 family)
MKWQDIVSILISILKSILDLFGSAKLQLSTLKLKMKGIDTAQASLVTKIIDHEKEARAEDIPAWYKIALNELGVKEVPGDKNNARIVEYHSATSLKSNKDSVPWCASFVCWCLEKAGMKSPKSARARSFLGYGIEVTDPVPGDICVFARDGGGHVGFFHSESRSDIFVLGGNQADKVSIMAYPKTRLLGFRRPS